MKPRLILPAGADREDWIATRRKGVGGSDIAAILGLDKYGSPLTVFYSKTAPEVEQRKNPHVEEAAEWGNELEDVVARRFGRVTRTRVRRVGTLQHPEEEWRLVNIDRMVDGCPHGRCSVEVKTRSAYQLDEWGNTGREDEVPDSVALQVHWGLGITGHEHAHVAALIGGNMFRHYTVQRDDELIGHMVDVAGRFWRDHVLTGDPPPADASQGTTELLAHLWHTSADSIRIVDAGEVDPLLAKRAALKEQAKRVQAEIDGVENRMKQLLGDAEIALTSGGSRTAFTWKKNGTLATARLRRDHPELVAKYRRTVQTTDWNRLAEEEPEIHRSYRARSLHVPKSAKEK